MLGVVTLPRVNSSAGVRLGVDFGTSHTVAAVVGGGRAVQALLFDATPLLPSGVYAESGGGVVLTGRDAEVAGRRDPARFEPNPKRLVDDGAVLLGDREVPIVEVVAAILARVASEAVRVAGGPVGATVLTHPVTWGVRRRAVLTEAAALAGLVDVALVAEPVAAAVYFTRVLALAVPVGGAVAVYDLGAGTFDTAVLRRGAGDGWEVLANAGLAETGGLDLDAAIVDWVGERVGMRRPDVWRELLTASDDGHRRLRQALWTDARIAKEQLSRTSSAVIPVPGLDAEAHLTREEFEQRARPFLARTVELTATTVARAGLRVEDLAGVFLVGGSSRIPLVATLLHQRLGVAPTVIEQPELVVAQGSLLAVADSTGHTAGSSGHTAGSTGDLRGTTGDQAGSHSESTTGYRADAARPGHGRQAAGVGLASPAPAGTPAAKDATAAKRSQAPWLVVVLVVLLAAGYTVYLATKHGTSNSGDGSGGGASTSTAGVQRALSVQVGKAVWYDGYKLTFGTATLDADARLTVAVKVDNLGTSEGDFSPTVTAGYGNRAVDGRSDLSTVGGLASQTGTLVFDLDRVLTSLRGVTLTFGKGSERRATVPFDPAAKAVDLAPVTVPLSGNKTVGYLKYTLKPCVVRADDPYEHEQVPKDQTFIVCAVDAQLVGPTNLDYGLGDANFRVVLPDGTVTSPKRASNKLVNPQQVVMDLAVVFAVPGEPHGTYTLQLRDPGRLGYDTPTGDKVWGTVLAIP